MFQLSPLSEGSRIALVVCPLNSLRSDIVEKAHCRGLTVCQSLDQERGRLTCTMVIGKLIDLRLSLLFIAVSGCLLCYSHLKLAI